MITDEEVDHVRDRLQERWPEADLSDGSYGWHDIQVMMIVFDAMMEER